MAGLLDNLFNPSLYGGQNGGLLDFLRNTQMQQNNYQPSGGFAPVEQGPQPAQPIMVGGNQMPRIGDATRFDPSLMNAMAEMPSSQQTQGQMPQAASQSPSFFDNFGSMARPDSIVGMLLGGGGGKLAQQANLTANYLRSHGVPETDIAAAVGNGRVPGNPEVLKTLLATNMKRESFRPATDAERAAAGITGDNKTPLFINNATGEPKFGPPQTNVNVSTEKTGQAELANKGVQAYVDAQSAGRNAQQRIAMYDTFEKAAQGFTPGAAAETRLAAKRYLKDAGLIKGEDVPDGEVMQMISRQLAVHAQPKGQGSVSNYERELYAKSLPNMSQSPEGLKMAIGIIRKLEQFDQKVAEIYRQSARENRGLPNYLDVQDKIAALGSPLNDREMAAIQNPQSATSAPATQSGPKWQDIGGGVKIRAKQ